jgi:hypothetical protein
MQGSSRWVAAAVPERQPEAVIISKSEPATTKKRDTPTSPLCIHGIVADLILMARIIRYLTMRIVALY